MPLFTSVGLPGLGIGLDGLGLKNLVLFTIHHCSILRRPFDAVVKVRGFGGISPPAPI